MTTIEEKVQHPLAGSVVQEYVAFIAIEESAHPEVKITERNFIVKNVTERKFVLEPVNTSEVPKKGKRPGYTMADISEMLHPGMEDEKQRFTVLSLFGKSQLGPLAEIQGRAWVIGDVDKPRVLQNLQEAMTADLRDVIERAQNLQFAVLDAFKGGE